MLCDEGKEEFQLESSIDEGETVDFQGTAVWCVQGVAGVEGSTYGWDWREKSGTDQAKLCGPS